MNRQDPKSLREIIEEALSMTGMTDDFNRRRLSALWPEVVGPAINRMTVKRFVDGGILHVWMTSAVLKNELSFNRASLTNALNRAAGAEVITDIKFH